MTPLQRPSNPTVNTLSVIGAKVVNPRGEILGVIKEVTIDSRNGRIAYSVVSFGGFLRIGEQRFAIPFSAFDYDVTQNEYMLDVTKAKLEAAPGVDAKWKWATTASERCE